ncbi:RasGEF domain-containing protein [Waddlia chondrophila]|uniref:Ras-GEF domain-containing protein n=1 Tax=Waddlia chondrophila (strain ATCC VR-1470 / WSU 86-1044) TaxID=716544 RepID=D6YWH7_WADCW|nr:RasGEF domain-containing protein [Waddlia chondrophila]ADI38488.1 conserved hypothetical protein [Waddlia chondrophila WSU 86-1044]
MTPLTSTIKDIQVPEASPSNIQTFATQAVACFEAIQNACQGIVKNAERQQKYFKLEELRKQIKSLDTSQVKELSQLNQKIRREMRALRNQYQTNSHWLVLTQKQSHLVEIEPSISLVPRVKIHPDDLQASFKEIAALRRGVEKVRALQHLYQKAASLEESDSSELLIEIQRFSDSNLSLSEKILALKQIKWRDKDDKQLDELKALIDPTGKDFVQYFLRGDLKPKDAVNYITVVLKDRLMYNPSVSPLELLKSWPTSIEKKDSDQWIAALMKMESKKSIQDSFTNFTISYLLNCIDPSGLQRCAELNKKRLSSASFAKEVSEVIDTLETFGLDSKEIYQRYRFTTKENLPLQEMEKKMMSALLSESEIKQFAKALKSAVARDWLTFDMKTFMSGSKSFEQLIGNRLKIYDDLAEKYKNALKALSDEKEQAQMISNMLLLCYHLMRSGEFGLSFTLFSSGVDMTKNSCQKGWDIALKKHQKHHDFLEKVCDPVKNLKNLRKLISNRESEKIACVPFFAIVLKDIIQFKEQISQPRDNLIEQLFGDHGHLAKKIVDLLAKGKIEEEEKDWAKSHFFKDIQKLFRIIEMTDAPYAEKNLVRKKIVDILQQERELQLEILKRKRALNQGISLLSLYYSNQTEEESLSSLL